MSKEASVLTGLVVVLMSSWSAAAASYVVHRGQRIPVVASRTHTAWEITSEGASALVELCRFVGAPARLQQATGGRTLLVVDQAALAPERRDGLHKILASHSGVVAPLKALHSHAAEPTRILDRYVLTRLQPHLAPADVQALGKRLDFVIDEQFRYAENAFRLRARSVAHALELSLELLRSGHAVYAQPDELVKPELYSIDVKDDFYPNQWHLNSDGGIGADTAWGDTTGDESVVIAVADTGVEISHPEFAGLPGKIVHPLDVFDRDTDPTPPASGSTEMPQDQDAAMEFMLDAHGTNCAGLAAAPLNHGGAEYGGVVGVCPDCSIMPIRLGTGNGMWSLSSLVLVFDHVREHGAAVMSNSWDVRSAVMPEAVYDALQAAIDAGVLVFFAAGNGGATVNLRGFAAHPGVMAVAGVSHQGKHVAYSDKGPTVDIAAPTMQVVIAFDMPLLPSGPGIQTTDLVGSPGLSPMQDQIMSIFSGPCDLHHDYTCYFSGTSASCPIAAGAGGLLLAAYPDLSPARARWVLASTADRVGETEYDARGWNPELGHGRINIAAAIERLRLADPCASAPADEGDCEDGADNDCDGLADDADPDCGYTYPPPLDASRWGARCKPTMYHEDEDACGLDMDCAGIGPTDLLGAQADGICVALCEDTCMSGFDCAVFHSTEAATWGYCMKSCTQPSACGSGYDCVLSDHVREQSVGVCMPTCSTDAQCPEGLTCNSALSICGATEVYSGTTDVVDPDPGDDPTPDPEPDPAPEPDPIDDDGETADKATGLQNDDDGIAAKKGCSSAPAGPVVSLVLMLLVAACSWRIRDLYE